MGRRCVNDMEVARPSCPPVSTRLTTRSLVWDGSFCPDGLFRIPPERSNKWLILFQVGRLVPRLKKLAQPENPFDIDYGPGEDKRLVSPSAMLLGYPMSDAEVLPELAHHRITEDESFIAAVDDAEVAYLRDLEDVSSTQEYDPSRRHSCTCQPIDRILPSR